MKKIPNGVLGGAMSLIVLLMFSFAYANVPLFKMFCARFGLNGANKAGIKGWGTETPSSSAGPILKRDIRVDLMGVSASGLPMMNKTGLAKYVAIYTSSTTKYSETQTTLCLISSYLMVLRFL